MNCEFQAWKAAAVDQEEEEDAAKVVEVNDSRR
jgi:hypothetical protein